MLKPALTLQWILWLWSSLRGDKPWGFRWAAVRAIYSLTLCGTGGLGTHVYECAEHGEELVPNSCRRRDCPRCVGRQSFNWCAALEARLLDCDHFHVVFTLTGKLLPYWRHNRAAMADLLFAAASETLKELLADSRYMGGTPAMLGVLHTHGSQLNLHPHVHILISAAGLGPGGALARARRPKTLLPFLVLRRAFQMKFLHGLARLANEPRFYLPKGTTGPELRALISELFAESPRSWNVMAFRRANPRPVVRYLSRTVYGGPIRDSRILAVTADEVRFLHQNWRHREEGSRRSPPWTEIRLHINDFVARWSEHVAEPGQKTVRYWGLLAPGAEARLDLARAALGQRPTPEPDEPAESDDGEPVVRCRKCGAPMTVRELPPTPIVLSRAARSMLHARASPLSRYLEAA